jgi:hypothetical protein
MPALPVADLAASLLAACRRWPLPPSPSHPSACYAVAASFRPPVASILCGRVLLLCLSWLAGSIEICISSLLFLVQGSTVCFCLLIAATC